MKNFSVVDLSSQQQTLLKEACKVRLLSYSPYSQFSVGCAVLTESREIILGVNVENASYGGTICAERSALCAAVSQGHTIILSLAIVAAPTHSTSKHEISSPCGLCRQFISEFSHLSGKDIEIILSTPELDQCLVTSIKELLPHSFGPEKLIS